MVFSFFNKAMKARERNSDTAKAVRELKRNIAQQRHSGPPEERFPSRIKIFRDLAIEDPDNEAYPVILAMEIFMAFNAARDDGDPALRDALLEELWSVSTQWRVASVREYYAKALFNTLLDMERERSAVRGASLLAILQTLADVWVDDTALRDILKRARRLNI